MKKSLLLFVMVIFLTACESKPGPKEVLQQFFEAQKAGNYEEAYQLISNDDKSVKSLAEYKKELEEPFVKALIGQISYRIVSVEVNGNTAKAIVEITGPDIASLMADIMAGAFSAAFGGKSDEEINKELAEKWANKKLPPVTKRETFTLVKENGEWKVFLNWRKEKEEAEKRAKISKLITEAKKLEKERRLVEALQKYDEAAKLDPAAVSKEDIKRVENKIKEEKEKKEYIKKYLKLYTLESRYYRTIFDEVVPGVKFKIKNEGNRTLREVEVTVYFKDKNGKIIAEEKYYPVLVTELSLGDNKPLKPGYIWQMKRGHFYKADKVPDEWQEGFISAEITNIEFMD